MSDEKRDDGPVFRIEYHVPGKPGPRHSNLREGEHIRFWVEDGRLHLEKVYQ